MPRPRVFFTLLAQRLAFIDFSRPRAAGNTPAARAKRDEMMAQDER
ncbi:MAG TPA: hypothetical protein VGV59_14745 [Pyrinomonadaceae bacterium]|nr:hypothetical protein [Pyrinomonadaceae bacterium]